MNQQSSTNINNSFFRGVYKNAWRKIIPQGLTEAEVDFILDVASLKADNELLDLMCGYGRHSLEIARRGIKVIATDNLEDYIDEINAITKNEKLRLKTVLSDAVNVNLRDRL